MRGPAPAAIARQCWRYAGRRCPDPPLPSPFPPPTLLSIMKSPVHEEVMLEVCWPANSTAMSRPVISSSVSWRPPSTFWGLRGMGVGGGGRLAVARLGAGCVWRGRGSGEVVRRGRGRAWEVVERGQGPAGRREGEAAAAAAARRRGGSPCSHLVARVAELLQHVLLLGGGRAPRLDDLGKDLAQLGARPGSQREGWGEGGAGRGGARRRGQRQGRRRGGAGRGLSRRRSA
jgi:hypothetical protein